MGLNVRKPKTGVYLVWTPNDFGIIPPKLQYEEDADGTLRLTKVKGQIKAISINSLVVCSCVGIGLLITSEGKISAEEMIPLLLGIIGFMILLNYLGYLATKWKIEKQLKNDTHT